MLYYYIGLEDYDSWRNLLGVCSLSTKSFRGPVWQNEISVNIFPYQTGHEPKGNTCRSNQWIAFGEDNDPSFRWDLTPKEQLGASFRQPFIIKYWMSPFAKRFSIASTDASECAIALDNVAREIAAAIDGDDGTAMEVHQKMKTMIPRMTCKTRAMTNLISLKKMMIATMNSIKSLRQFFQQHMSLED